MSEPETFDARPRMPRRDFFARTMLASAGMGLTGSALAAETDSKVEAVGAKQAVRPGLRDTLPTGTIGSAKLSRLISGGNLLSGWTHQRDLLFVRRLAEAYLTEKRRFDTLQMLEEMGVNSMVIDMMQSGIVKQYKRERGGQMQTVVSVREGWGEWSKGNWPGLKREIQEAMEEGPAILYLHGGYADRLVQANRPENLEVIAQALAFIREQGFAAGLGAHALEVLKACDEAKIEPDFYVKTFHHDQYWSATPKERRKPFCVDGKLHLDHNEFHDNIFCIDAEGTARFMLDKPQPWIAFKVLAAGAIHPRSGFKYAFEHGADFVAVGMFDFEVAEDVQTAQAVLQDLDRERPWTA